MAIIFDNGGSGSGGTGAGSIAKDMYFVDIAARDQFTTDNPDRIYQGVTCAVVNGTSYDYFQYDDTAKDWRDANLIFQGKQGDKGKDGTNGTNGSDGKDGRGIDTAALDGDNLKFSYSDGTSQDVGRVVGHDGVDGKDGVVQELIAGSNVTIDSSDPAKPIISSTGGEGGKDPSEGFQLNASKGISGTDTDGNEIPMLGIDNTNKLILGDISHTSDVVVGTSTGLFINTNERGVRKVIEEGQEGVTNIIGGTNITVNSEDPSSPVINAEFLNPSEGFTLDRGKSISATDNINQTNTVLGFSGGGDFELGFPDNTHNSFINVQDGLFVNLEGDVTKKVLLEGDAPSFKGFTVDHSTAGEVVAKDGSSHDAISITDTDDLVLGTRSETIKSLTLATGATKIDVYRKDSDTGVEIVDRVVMASELDQFKGLDDYWIEGAKTDGQILKGTHPETAKEVFSGVDDMFMWKYSSYTYTMPLSFVAHKLTVNTQAGVLAYNPDVNRFTLNASGASGSVTDLGWTIGGGASAVKGDDTIPVSYHSLLTSANTIAAGSYALDGAKSADLFTFQWSEGTVDTVTIPLSIVPDNGEFTVSGTGDRIKLVHSSAGYTLNISSNIEALGFLGHTTGMNSGSTVVNVLKGRGKRTLYLREGEYVITEDDIQNDIIIQAEPFIKDANNHYSTTVIFPSIDIITKYYYIPLVNEDDKNTLPHIENLNIQCWLDPEGTRKDSEHRLYLKSTGDAIAWGTSTLIGDYEGCFIHRPANDTTRNIYVSFNFMHINVGGSSSGAMMGYTAQSANEDHVFSLSTVPPAPPSDPTIPELRYISLNTDYHDLNAEVWGTVLADNVPEQDIGYFYLVGKGSSFSNLPESLTLVADADYSIATEVTKGEDGGFAQRLSIVSPTDTNANNRTIQRAGLSFDLGKQAWAEVMLKRDAIVFNDMTVDVPKTFGTIVAGDNMTGIVVDDVLTLSALPPDQRDTFDTLTTRVLNVHESPDNSDKFTQWAVDGNFNTEVHAIGDTHYYSKDKNNNSLTEAYQVYENGKVEFKNGVEFTNDTRIDHQNELGLVLQGDTIYGVDKDGYEHFFVERNNFNVKSKIIQNVRDGIADDDAANISQLKALEAKVTTLTELILQQSEHIHSLEESNGIAFGDFDIFSSTPNEVRVDMHKLNGETVSKTIQLGNNPPHVDPTPPDPSDFNVYYGWDINSRALIQASDILDYESTDERSATLDMQAENLLTTEFSLTRADNSKYKYMYVAYPKDVVDPNPYRVEYSGFVADWLIREITINNMTYVVLITELPNIAQSFTIKLHN